MTKVEELVKKNNDLKRQVKKLMGEIEKNESRDMPVATILDEKYKSDKRGWIAGFLGSILLVFLFWFDTSHIFIRAIVILIIVAFIGIQIPQDRFTLENAKKIIILVLATALFYWGYNFIMWLINLVANLF